MVDEKCNLFANIIYKEIHLEKFNFNENSYIYVEHNELYVEQFNIELLGNFSFIV